MLAPDAGGVGAWTGTLSRDSSNGGCCSTTRAARHYSPHPALHKSMRNNDADAAIYWLARITRGWRDPLRCATVVRFARGIKARRSPGARHDARRGRGAFSGDAGGNTALAQPSCTRRQEQCG
jgi:hypothetical protein